MVFDVAAYLARISYDGPVESTLAVLRRLHLAHLQSVPFENLDIHLGRPISLAEEDLFAKVVRQRRGGFCYELNGLFAGLLREIGYDVTLLAGQFPRPDGSVPVELDHLLLRVEAPGMGPVLADIAAGRDSFASPLVIDGDAEQVQPEVDAAFRLLPEDEAVRLWRRVPGNEWEPVYRFTWQPRQMGDFAEGCRYHQTSPESGFTRKQLCTRMTNEGRITLSDNVLITTRNGTRQEETLPDDAAAQAALRLYFGIDLSLSSASTRYKEAP